MNFKEITECYYSKWLEKDDVIHKVHIFYIPKNEIKHNMGMLIYMIYGF